MTEWTSQFVTASDGLRLHVGQMTPRTPPDPPRLPLLCLPGLTRNGDDFTALARAVVATGERAVIALDSRGRGGSDFDPEWKNYTLATECADLHTVLDALGVARAIFLGTSRGGMLTALSETLRPGLAAGVILNDIGPVLETEGIRLIQAYVGRLPQMKTLEEAAEALQRTFGADFPKLDAAGWLRWARRTFTQAPDGLALRYDPAIAKGFALLDLSKPLPQTWEMFAALNALPMLILRGDNTNLFSLETAQKMLTLNPQAQLQTVPDEGHAPLIEDAATIAAIQAFLRTVP